MEYLLGKSLSESLLTELEAQIQSSKKIPGLAVLLIGDDPASHIYVDLKERAAKRIGMYFERHHFPVDVTEEVLLEKISVLNANPKIHGIIVQLPLPQSLDEKRIVAALTPSKDADGFHPETLKRYFGGDPTAQPVFPRAVARLILLAGQDFQGQKGIAIVNSKLFGEVMSKTLELLGLLPQIIERSQLENEQVALKEAKVVVTACGEPGLLKGELFSAGAIVIDGGITRVGERVFGDVDLESVAPVSGFIAPVPGGVGPLTVASLLERVTEQALLERGVPR